MADRHQGHGAALFAPERRGPAVGPDLPTHVRTPEGEELPLFGEALAAGVGRRHGAKLEMSHLDRRIFDDASISVITSATVGEIASLAGQRPDVRRFRSNILVSSLRSAHFEEDEWVEGALSFGDTDDTATIAIPHLDERCSMVNFDPDSALAASEVLKAIVWERDNEAGVYGTVTRRGRLAVGQAIFVEPSPERRART